NPNILRMRRVYDTWSTAYTNAPALPVLPFLGPLANPPQLPVIPSYPPPYPVPLRGIQVQIRVTDPKSIRIKTLTIRHDFSDKP
ncbi:MAG: type II secretion system protein, partial [Isosphaeraceae bacterium]|nr:type II secretion system protein [Isosphaeraceae bacterium]